MIDQIIEFIDKQEGWDNPDPTVVPRRLNDPGDLIFAHQAGATPIQVGSHTFAKFDSAARGQAWGYVQVCLDIARGMSLRQLIMSWAPPSDRNNTETYLRNVAAGVGVANVDQPLMDFLPLHPLLKAA